ncbi:hypothetical protein D3C75_1000750 [compost metagenome]
MVVQEGPGKCRHLAESGVEQVYVIARLLGHQGATEPLRVEVQHAVLPALIMGGQPVMDLPWRDGDHTASAAQGMAATVVHALHTAADDANGIAVMGVPPKRLAVEMRREQLAVALGYTPEFDEVLAQNNLPPAPLPGSFFQYNPQPLAHVTTPA